MARLAVGVRGRPRRVRVCSSVDVYVEALSGGGSRMGVSGPVEVFLYLRAPSGSPIGYAALGTIMLVGGYGEARIRIPAVTTSWPRRDRLVETSCSYAQIMALARQPQLSGSGDAFWVQAETRIKGLTATQEGGRILVEGRLERMYCHPSGPPRWAPMPPGRRVELALVEDRLPLPRVVASSEAFTGGDGRFQGYIEIPGGLPPGRYRAHARYKGG